MKDIMAIIDRLEQVIEHSFTHIHREIVPVCTSSRSNKSHVTATIVSSPTILCSNKSHVTAT